MRFDQPDSRLRAGDLVYRLPVNELPPGPGDMVRVRREDWAGRWLWMDAGMLLPHELVPLPPHGLPVAYAAIDVAAFAHGRMRWLQGPGLRGRLLFDAHKPRLWDSPGAIIRYLRDVRARERALSFVRFDKTPFAYVPDSAA